MARPAHVLWLRKRNRVIRMSFALLVLPLYFLAACLHYGVTAAREIGAALREFGTSVYTELGGFLSGWWNTKHDA